MPNYPMLSLAGPPTDGEDEVQLVTGTGTISGGTWDLDLTACGGPDLTDIPWDITAAGLQALVDPTLSLVITVAGGPIASDPFSFTFSKYLGGTDLTQLTSSDTNLTGAGATLTDSTDNDGVVGTFKGAQSGCLLADTVNGILYRNSGSRATPAWVTPDAEPAWVLTP